MVDSEVNRTPHQQMENTKEKAVSIAKQIISEHIDRVRAMNPENVDVTKPDTRPKSASTFISFEPQTEEAYSEYLKNEIAVLL